MFILLRIIKNIWKFIDFLWRHIRSRWRHRKKRSGGIQDLGLNFYMQKIFLNFDHPDSLESVWKEAYFSIFKVEKIVEKMPKSNIWNLFYTNSNMLNPMSTSVFLDREVRKIPNSNFAGYPCESHQQRSSQKLLVNKRQESRLFRRL